MLLKFFPTQFCATHINIDQSAVSELLVYIEVSLVCCEVAVSLRFFPS